MGYRVKLLETFSTQNWPKNTKKNIQGGKNKKQFIFL